MDTVRAFIAVDIGEEIRSRLDELQRRLRKVHANVRWVKPRSIHLTMAFLGDLSAEQIGAVQILLDTVAADFPAFELRAAGTGFFGRAAHPRVIWAGISDCPPLVHLQSRIAMKLHDAALPFDNKAFSPHLTLGRVKGIDHHIGPLLQKLEKFNSAELGEICIDRVELIQSELTPKGAEYRILHRSALV